MKGIRYAILRMAKSGVVHAVQIALIFSYGLLVLLLGSND